MIKKKNVFNIVCDGKEWKDRKFIINFDNTSKNIILKAFYDYNNLEFGNILYINENLNDTLKSINNKINTDKYNPENYFKRGVILLEEGLFEMAKNDFNKSLELGISDVEIKEYINNFIENLNNKQIYYDILNISELAKDFFKKELLLDVE